MASKYKHHVTVGEFSKAIQTQIDGYVSAVVKDIPDIVEKSAKKCVDSIKANGVVAGIPNGAYLKGWTYKVDAVNIWGSGAFCTVRNPKHYRLAHLLEHGHAIVVHGKHIDDKRTKPYPHIADAEQEAVLFLENTIKNQIESTD